MARLASFVVVLVFALVALVAPAAAVPPTTAPPTTAPPTTAPPPTTPAPTTPDETNPGVVTPVEPTTEPVTPTLPVTPTPGSGGGTPVLLWVLVGLGALVVIGLIAWLVTTSTRRSDLVAVWQSRRRATYAEGAALHDAVMSAQEQIGRLTPADEAARWADIQRRADDFTQRLYQLRESAPDEVGASRAEDVLVSLQALRSAIDAERSAGTQAGMTAGITRSRLAEFRASLHALRADY